MTRNTERRVEIACPITEAPARQKIHKILDACLRDTLKARVMQSDGTYLRRTPEPRFDCQQFLLAGGGAPGTPRRRQARPRLPQAGCARDCGICSGGHKAGFQRGGTRGSRIPPRLL